MTGGEPVDDDDIVFRRVPSQSHTRDQRDGRIRPSSDCFRDSEVPPGPMSVLLDSELAQAGRVPESLVPGPGGDALVAMEVRDLRALGLDVQRDPVDDEEAHAVVVGDKPRKLRRRIAEVAVYVVGPR